MNLEAVLSGITIVLYLTLLFTGRQRLEFGRYFQAFASLAGFAILGVSVFLLGWPGVFILVGVTVVAAGIRAVMLAAEQETLLVSAQIHGAFTDRAQAMAFPKELRASHRALRSIGPIELARLIERLAMRGRRATEIRSMAAPIAMLHIVFKSELIALIDRFDRLLRLWRKPAHEATHVADVLTAGTQTSAATFDEMLDSMIAVANPDT